MNTTEQFEYVIAICRSLFEKKLKDYGVAFVCKNLDKVAGIPYHQPV